MADDLGANAVTSGKFADGSVGIADLGLNAVTGAKIANGAAVPAQSLKSLEARPVAPLRN